MTWDEYHEQDHVEGFLDYLADTYEFVDVESIGESYEGRPMRVIKVNIWWLGKYTEAHSFRNDLHFMI